MIQSRLKKEGGKLIKKRFIGEKVSNCGIYISMGCTCLGSFDSVITIHRIPIEREREQTNTARTLHAIDHLK